MRDHNYYIDVVRGQKDRVQDVDLVTRPITVDRSPKRPKILAGWAVRTSQYSQDFGLSGCRPVFMNSTHIFDAAQGLSNDSGDC